VLKARGIAAAYSIFMGVAMIGMWAIFLLTGQVPELSTTPIATSLHIVAEFLTAFALLVGGYGLLAKREWGEQAHLVSLGMLLYAVVQASGYFGQQGEVAFIGMFAVFAILTVVFVGLALLNKEGTS
jgi:hypothetical protein